MRLTRNNYFPRTSATCDGHGCQNTWTVRTYIQVTYARLCEFGRRWDGTEARSRLMHGGQIVIYLSAILMFFRWPDYPPLSSFLARLPLAERACE
ncbi:hypothetical protein K440DRAFT_92977 [Wilcoxina mikolae CBS 423.85]|nr:hypothetical protein K440DRAFT_92977 [Wilcoxina mikolae CBS 423.85]